MARPFSGSVEESKRALSQQRRQQKKQAQQLAMKTGVWDRCKFKVPGKDRYCAQQRMSRDSEFCVTHSTGEGKRVPCPLNPNHTVSENRLESHLKICNRTRQSKELEQQPYYSKNINSGPPLPPAEDEGDERTDGYREPAGNTAPLDEAFVRDLIARVAVAHAEHVGHLPTEVLDPPEVQPLHRASLEGGTGFRKGRHVLQQASILGHMLKRGLVGPGSGTLHVEMGAGKGALGQAISTAFPGSAITMVERSSVRHKADKKLDGATVRARIDIRDLNMAGLPSLTSAEGEQRPVVAVAKHLCGVATDLALRAMLTLCPQPEDVPAQKVKDGVKIPEAAAGSQVGSSPDSHVNTPSVNTTRNGEEVGIDCREARIGGVVFATCCHHVCAWRDYVGQEFLLDLGFTARDFDAMRRISAWISQEAILSAASTKGSTETDSSAAAEIPEKDASIHTQPSEVGAKVATTATSAGSKEAVTTPGKQEELTLSPFEPHRPAVSDEEKTGYNLGDQNLQNNRKGHWNDEKTNAEEAREDGSESHIGSSGSSHKEAEEGPGPFPALSHAAKAKAARECKRLLDRGRVWFVQEKLRLTCDLVHFVERKVTPENALLLAYRTSNV